MKGIREFKGYRTETAYDMATDQFVQQRIPHEGFEAKAGSAKSEPPKKTVKTKPPLSANQRLAALRQRIEAGRATEKVKAKPAQPSHLSASAR